MLEDSKKWLRAKYVLFDKIYEILKIEGLKNDLLILLTSRNKISGIPE
jgi:hypothetical protein